MKVFLLLPFLFLLFGSSQESALSHKRSIRGLNTTLQTNFNGTFQIKNPCTNADVETSSYVASHEFHHHIKEDNWSDYLQKCSTIISGFLRGIGNLVRYNSKQNAAFNFHVNTSISQKRDVGHCAKQCDSLPTIVIEAESCELPPPCKSAPKVHNECLLKQDERQNSPQPPCSTEDTKKQKDQELIYENINPLSGFSTPSAQSRIEETTNFSKNQETTCTTELPETSGRDFTASITIQPEDEFTTPVTPTPCLDYSEDGLFTNPEAQDYPYSTPTIPEYQTTPPKSFNDEKIINNEYRVVEIPDQTSPSGFERESIGVEKPFKYQQTVPVGLGERNVWVEGMIPPSERFQPADLKTKPNSQILDKFPLQQEVQFIDQQKEEISLEGGSNQPETSYPSQTYPTTPSVDYLAIPPPSQILPPSIPENEFQPPSLTNKFSEATAEVCTSATEQPLIPESFPTPNYPDVYTTLPEETVNDFYTPVIPEPSKNEKIPPFSDKLDNIYTTISPPESVTFHDSEEDVLNDERTSHEPDEEFYIKNQPPSPTFLNEKTTPKNLNFEPFIPTLRKQSSKAQPEPESLTILQPSLTYPGNEETSFSNFEKPIQPPITPEPPVTYPRGDFYPSNSLGNAPLPASDPIIYAPSHASPEVTQPENPRQSPIRTFEPPTTPLPPVTYPENTLYSSDYPSTVENTPSSAFEPIDYSQASTEVEEPEFPNIEKPTQLPRPDFESMTLLPPVAYPEGEFYPSDNQPSPVFNRPQTPQEVFKPNNYVEASSEAFAEVQESPIPNFEKPTQPPRPVFEPITTSLPPVTYPEGEFYPSDNGFPSENSPVFSKPQIQPEAFKPNNYVETSSQAFAGVQEIRTPNFEKPTQPQRPDFEPVTTPISSVAYPEEQAFTEVQEPNFENDDQPPRPAFKPITPLPTVTYPEGEFYPLGNQPAPVFNRPQTPLEILKPNFVKASSQVSAEVQEIPTPNFEKPTRPPRPTFEPITTPLPRITYPEGEFYPPSESPSPSENSPAFNEPQIPFEPNKYEEASSQAFAEVQEIRTPNFEKPTRPPRPPRPTFEPITTPLPPVAYPEGEFYPSDNGSPSENSPVFNEPQTLPEAFKPNNYVEASSEAFAEIQETPIPEKPTRTPRPVFEPITTSLPTVAYPEDDFYPSDNQPNPVFNGPQTPLEAFKQNNYAEAFAEVQESPIPNFEKPIQPPRPDFEPMTPLPPVAYPEGEFYPSDNGFPSENSPVFSKPQVQPEAFKPNNYVEASSEAFAEVQESPIPNFEKPTQLPRPILEPITTSLPPVTYPEHDFYPLDNQPTPVFNGPQTPLIKSNNHAEASSQAFAGVQEIRTPNFEKSTRPPRPAFEPITTPLPPVAYPEEQAFTEVQEPNFENDDQPPRPAFKPITPLPTVTYPEGEFYPSENMPTPAFSEPQTPLEPNNYVEASSQASAEVRDIGFPELKNPIQPPVQSFEPPVTLPPPVTYPEGDFYPSDYPPALENTFGEPQTRTEAFEPITYTKASSKASVEVDEPRVSNFKPPTSIAYSEASSQAFAKVDEPVNSNFNNFDERSRPPFIQSMTPNSEDYPTTQSEPIIEPNVYNRPPPTDLPPEADLPFWTERPIEPQPLPVNVEDVAIASSNSQSDLQPLNEFATPQPLDYYDEKIPERFSQKPLVPLDTTSIPLPQPQPEEITTPPSYQDYTPEEEPFIGDSTPPAVKSQEKIPIYSPPFELEPQPQPQSQPSYDIPGDNTLASKTFENSETTNQQPVTSFQNLDTQDQTTFSTDLVTTPTPFPDIPSFQTPPRSKPVESITNYQPNIGAQETLLLDDNVSPQPQPTTAVKPYKEIVTTEYQTSPAPSPQPQMTMNNANQHPNGKIPELFTPKSDSSTSAVAVARSELINSENPVEEAPQPPLNYPNPNLFLPYNNQLRSQPVFPPHQQELLKNPPQNPSENVNQFTAPVRGVNVEHPLMAPRIPAPMQPGNNMWMPRPNEHVPFHPNNNLRPPVQNLQVPPGRFLYPGQNFNPRELYFPQGHPVPNFPPSYHPRRPFNPDFQNPPRVPITDFHFRPPPPDSIIRGSKIGEETIRADLPTTITESEYAEKFLNNKEIPEPMRDDRRFEPSENYGPLNREYGPRNFPQQVEPFYGGFPPNASYPNYGQMIPRNGFPVPGQVYPGYDQVFPHPPPRPQFVRDEIIPQSMNNMEFDRRVPGTVENQYYPERPQHPVNYQPDREQQHSNPLFHALEHQMKIPLQEPSSPEMPNESERNYFRDDSPGWERPNPPPPPPPPESQLVSESDITNPSNNPDRTANGRINYMDRPLRKPFYEDRMRPVSTPERF